MLHFSIWETSEIKGNCCDIWTLRGAGAAGAAGPAPDQVGGAEPQPLLDRRAPSPACSRVAEGSGLGRQSIHQAIFIFGFNIPLREASERFFLFPPAAVLPSPTAAPRSPVVPASTGRSSRSLLLLLPPGAPTPFPLAA